MVYNFKALKINYEVSGEGYPVLLLHGWGASLETMRPVAARLSPFFKVYMPDFPGCGKSDVPKTPWELEDYAEFVENFTLNLEISCPIVFGHSHGGRVALFMASNGFPVRKLVLIDSAGIKLRKSFILLFRQTVYKMGRIILSCPLWASKTKDVLERYRSHFGSVDYKAANPVMRQTMVKLLNHDLTPVLDKIKVPSLLIWGELDTDTPLKCAKIMEKRIPDAGLVVFQGCGHFSYLENLNYFISIVMEFLKEEAKGL